MAIFDAALREMASVSANTYGPTPFQTYLTTHGLRPSNTWQSVSVDSLGRLAPELRLAGTMVFRLGSRAGASGTHFALAKYINGWSDFFLMDEDLAFRSRPQVFLPRVPNRRMFAFQLLPKLTETSLVNLALGSGLLQAALGLNDADDQIIPATGQSTFSFAIFPHQAAHEPWEHANGQVEIDALFVGQRNGNETLFLIEAKTGLPRESLAKHKLCYPLAALRQTVPDYINIVPIYLKTWSETDGRHFLVVECSIGSDTPIVISELVPSRIHHLVLPGFG